MQPVVDLVACAYQASTETEAFLRSLGHVAHPFTLCVIENSSPDDTVREVLKGPALDAVRNLPNCVDATIVFNDENVGYARAINQGVSLGGAPYVAALNCDIEFLEDDACSKVIAFMEREPDVGVVGPRTVTSDGRLTHAGIFYENRDVHRQWLVQDNPSVWDVHDVPTVSGATYFVRRSMWEQLTDCYLYRQVAPDAEGAFLPTRHFYEETWCSYHARAHGWRVVYLGTAKMIHQWHKSSPVGSQPLGEAEELFRTACAAHEIELSW